MTAEEFERAIDEALQSIPAEFLDALENVAIVAQDEPTAWQLGRANDDAWDDEADDADAWTDEEIAAWDEAGMFGAEEDGESLQTEVRTDEEAADCADALDCSGEDGFADDLLGLYDGIPLTERGDYAWDVPDVITVFKGPHERLCSSREEMVEEIRKTVVHEIGHYFGMDEDEIERMGYA